MTLPQTVIKGSIVVQGVPESACFDNFSQLLNSLGQFLSVEIAQSSISNIVISNQQPGAADVGKFWYRLSNAGTFLGVYKFSGTKWVVIIAPSPPNQVFWMAGNSTTPPDGFTLLPDNNLVFSNAQYAVLFPDLTKCYPATYLGI